MLVYFEAIYIDSNKYYVSIHGRRSWIQYGTFIVLSSQEVILENRWHLPFPPDAED